MVPEEGGPTIDRTPSDSGPPEWQLTPEHHNEPEQETLLVTPIDSGDGVNVETYPAVDEKDWRDAILVFPEGSGIAPLYVVYQARGKDGRFISSGEPGRVYLSSPSL